MIELYSDPACKQPLQQTDVAGDSTPVITLPQNKPGGTSKTMFYLYNNSRNSLENICILHGDGSVEFTYPNVVAAYQKAMVQVEWRCPLDFAEAKRLLFKISADEVAKPRL